MSEVFFLKTNINIYKRQFDRELRHIKIILSHERHHIPVEAWLNLVEATKESILRSPEESFCTDLPPKTVFYAAIEKVFDGFLEDQRLLAQQTSKPFKIPSKGRLKSK